MNKFDYITKDGDLTLSLANDLEQVANKYGLTLLSFVEDDENIVAYFDLYEEKNNEDNSSSDHDT